VLVLFGLSRTTAYVLKRVGDAYFAPMLCIMAIAGVLAYVIPRRSDGQRIGT
jgi:hypothetical protein